MRQLVHYENTRGNSPSQRIPGSRLPDANGTYWSQLLFFNAADVPVSVAQSMRMSGISEEASTRASASTSRPSASGATDSRLGKSTVRVLPVSGLGRENSQPNATDKKALEGETPWRLTPADEKHVSWTTVGRTEAERAFQIVADQDRANRLTQRNSVILNGFKTKRLSPRTRPSPPGVSWCDGG